MLFLQTLKPWTWVSCQWVKRFNLAPTQADKPNLTLSSWKAFHSLNFHTFKKYIFTQTTDKRNNHDEHFPQFSKYFQENSLATDHLNETNPGSGIRRIHVCSKPLKISEMSLKCQNLPTSSNIIGSFSKYSSCHRIKISHQLFIKIQQVYNVDNNPTASKTNSPNFE